MKIERTFLDMQMPAPEFKNGNFGAVLSTVESRTESGEISQRRQSEVQTRETRPERQRPEQSQAPEAEHARDIYIAEQEQADVQNYTVEEAYTYEALEEGYEQAYNTEELEIEIEKEAPQQSQVQEQDYTDEAYPYYPIITAVAQVLEVEPEEVVEILEKEAINPQDLEQRSYQHKVIQAAYQVEAPEELLQVEEITQVFEELNAAVEEAVKEVELKSYSAETEAVQEQTVSYTPQGVQEHDQAGDQHESFAGHGDHTEQQAAQKTEQDSSQNHIFNNVTVEQDQVSPTQKIDTPTATNTQTSPPQIMDQIKGQIKLSQSGAVSEMKMVLTPESLGEVSLRIATHNGVVVAQFVATSQRVKEIMEANLNQLQEELESQGLQVGELSVSVRQENQDQMDAFLREQEKSQQRISTIIKNIMDDDQLEQEQELQPEGTTVSYQV